MAYATAALAIKDGELIYGRGKVSAKCTGNGEYIYWPKGSTAMDASSHSSLVTVGSPLPGSVIDRVVNGLMGEADDDDDAAILAEIRVGLMMPTLKAMAMDDAKAEQEAQGSFSSEDDNEAEDADEEKTFGAGYAASLKATKEYWAKARRVKPSATHQAVRGRSNKPVAVDHVANNARKARGFSLFDTAKTIIKRQRKSA